MIKLLEGQNALVTGANSGIGKAIALGLARAGANVVVNYYEDAEAADKVIAEIKDIGQQGIAVQADVSDEKAVENLFNKTVEMFKTLDIVVGNAGIQLDHPVHEMPLKDWNRVLAVNLTGQFLCARAALRQFIKQGVREKISKAAGKLIHISSVHDIVPWAGHANYAASKGGLDIFMQTVAQGYGHRKIRCNSISPGAIETPINFSARDTKEEREALLELIPYGRIGEPEDIAEVAVWLASDNSDYINGETIYVDGGMKNYPGFIDNG